MINDKVKIVGIGACVMDTLVTVPNYPKEDTKLRAISSKPSGGGPTGTGLVAAQKLGEQAAYIGVLSDDNGGVFLQKDFEKYGVNTDCVDILSGYRSFTSVIWLAKDTATRTIVFDKGNLPPLQLNERQKQAIADSQILMIDGNEMDAAEEACKHAKENGTKVLYDCGGLYEGVEHLLKLTDVMIPSEEFALGHTGCETIEDAAARLYELYRPEIVVITCGKDGGIIYDGVEVAKYPAFLVEAVDTNGSGDVFHGAFAAGFIKGFDYKTCCYFASAVSAIKCTGVGARESVPDFDTVKQFLEEKGCSIL
jgi:sugar/nucleoside kinase (ribokinase family)